MEKEKEKWVGPKVINNGIPPEEEKFEPEVDPDMGMTEEEFNWDDARWEGGANSDFMSNLFTPRHLQINENPHTTDALAYGNAYDEYHDQGGFGGGMD